MLQFDAQTSSFILNGARLGRGTAPQDLVSRVLGTLEEVTGHPGWVNFTSTEGSLALFVTFRDGVAHSGYFYSNIPAVADWSQAERIEKQRREKHEAIMQGLFGTHGYEDAAIKVELIRDPRAFLEMIFFTLKG